MFINSPAAIEIEFGKIRAAAVRAHSWIALQSDDPMVFLRSVKFEKRGYHPISGKELNLIEQINQTWTYAVALNATRLLFEMHPAAEGFWLEPGAHMARELDIMSKQKILLAQKCLLLHLHPAMENSRRIYSS